MTRTAVADLVPSRSIQSTFLLQAKDRKTARNGSAYLDLEFRDSTGVIRGKLWDCDRVASDCVIGDIVEVEGSVEAYQGILQVSVRRIQKCRNSILLDFLPRTRQDPEAMYASLMNRIRSEPDGFLKQLLLGLMEDPALAEKYKLAPAAVVMHHAWLGGLLEHVNSLWQLGDRLCDHYPSLDRSLLLAGIVLHDLGKVEEFNFRSAFHYSTRGQLLGHIAIGLEMVQEKMRSLAGFPEPLKHQIEHMILSHHGKLEFGSPKEPMFPEALALHYLDELDSKLESMRAHYEAEKDRAGEWTSRSRSLGRELLKAHSAQH